MYLVSGGFRQQIYPVADSVNVPRENVYANNLLFKADGSFAGFDPEEPTSRSGGKRRVVEILKVCVVCRTGAGFKVYGSAHFIDADMAIWAWQLPDGAQLQDSKLSYCLNVVIYYHVLHLLMSCYGMLDLLFEDNVEAHAVGENPPYIYSHSLHHRKSTAINAW